jgi:hypothetical protein
LSALALAEAKALVAAPSEDNLTKFIAACEGKDFGSAVGGQLPKEFK